MIQQRFIIRQQFVVRQRFTVRQRLNVRQQQSFMYWRTKIHKYRHQTDSQCSSIHRRRNCCNTTHYSKLTGIRHTMRWENAPVLRFEVNDTWDSQSEQSGFIPINSHMFTSRQILKASHTQNNFHVNFSFSKHSSPNRTQID